VLFRLSARRKKCRIALSPDLARFHYGKQKQDDLIDYFKLTPKE
jgi:hypothetical protein